MHAKQRALQRYGLRLSSEDYDALVAMIAVSGASHLVRKLTNTRAIFNLKFQDKDIFVLYNSKTKRIVSFLTKEQIMEV